MDRLRGPPPALIERTGARAAPPPTGARIQMDADRAAGHELAKQLRCHRGARQIAPRMHPTSIRPHDVFMLGLHLRAIDALQAKIDAIGERLQEVLRDNFREAIQRLETIPGISERSAAGWRRSWWPATSSRGAASVRK